MGMRIRTMAARLLAAGLVSCAALFPFSSSALVLGDITVHSSLGQPLRATVPVRVGTDEEVEAGCFSLVRPERQDDFTYLTSARLILEEVNGRLQLGVRSQQSISEPFVRLLIQVDCGQGRFNRIFTVLLDPEETVSQPLPVTVQRVSPAQQAIAQKDAGLSWDVREGETLQSIAAGFYPGQARMQSRMVRAIRGANTDLRDVAANSALLAGSVITIPALQAAAPQVARTGVAPRKPGKPRVTAKPVAAQSDAGLPEKMPPASVPVAGEGEFRLKLSSEGLDLSALGKLTEEQRQQLREKQRLLDADDQVANTLSMKNRIMQLESEIGELQKALAKTNDHLAMSERLAVASASANKPAQNTPGMLDGLLGGPENISLRGMAGVGLIMALLVSVWWRWRRRQAEAWLEAELNQEFSPEPAYAVPPVLQGEKSFAATAPVTEKSQEDDFYHGPTSIFDTNGESVTFTEAESVLDEADLYLAYGWSNRAIELLQEYLERHPDDIHVWKKLFETYSSQGMKQEFEQLALRCQATMDDSGLWVLVQKLGRQLDAENPLYSSSLEAEGEALAETAPPVPEIPTLDTPLEFILDDKPPELKEVQPEVKNESGSLELDPLFPDLIEAKKTDSESGPDVEKRG